MSAHTEDQGPFWREMRALAAKAQKASDEARNEIFAQAEKEFRALCERHGQPLRDDQSVPWQGLQSLEKEEETVIRVYTVQPGGLRQTVLVAFYERYREEKGTIPIPQLEAVKFAEYLLDNIKAFNGELELLAWADSFKSNSK
jgi:hypothetical protein